MCLERTDHRNPQEFTDLYHNVTQGKYTELYMDVTNQCNAMCRYCKTGQANCSGASAAVAPYYMTPAEFERLHRHLLDHALITSDCIFRIYNWYEPSLNPHLPALFNYMHRAGIRLDMSTNAGRAIDFSQVESCGSWYGILFSMPGFSQDSYNRIHRFDFEQVKENIRRTMQAIRARGFRGYAYINYHMYQFNIGEVRAAKAFADELGIGLHTIFAYFNGTGGNRAYLDGSISPQALKAASRDLFFYHLDELIENKERYWREFNEPESITLSEFCNLIPCRGSNDDDRIKSIFEITTYDEIRAVYEAVFRQRVQNPQYGNGWVWGHSYKRSNNHLFGFSDNTLI